VPVPSAHIECSTTGETQNRFRRTRPPERDRTPDAAGWRNRSHRGALPPAFRHPDSAQSCPSKPGFALPPNGRPFSPRCGAEEGRFAGCSDLDVSGDSHYRSHSLNSVWILSYATLRLGGAGRSSECAAHRPNGPALPSGLGEGGRLSPGPPGPTSGPARQRPQTRHAGSSLRIAALRSLYRVPPRRLSRHHPRTVRQTRRLCEQRVDNRPVIRERQIYLANDSDRPKSMTKSTYTKPTQVLPFQHLPIVDNLLKTCGRPLRSHSRVSFLPPADDETVDNIVNVPMYLQAADRSGRVGRRIAPCSR